MSTTVPTSAQFQRILVILLSQFPDLSAHSAKDILGEVRVTISRKTKRIKTVLDGKTQLFSLRTSDGRLLPSFEAAERLVQHGCINNLVMVTEDAAPFVSTGKSAFCKHVLQASEAIRVGAEVFVVDPDKNLLAVGSAVQPGYAMIELQAGVAVKVKHYRR